MKCEAKRRRRKQPRFGQRREALRQSARLAQRHRRRLHRPLGGSLLLSRRLDLRSLRARPLACATRSAVALRKKTGQSARRMRPTTTPKKKKTTTPTRKTMTRRPFATSRASGEFQAARSLRGCSRECAVLVHIECPQRAIPASCDESVSALRRQRNQQTEIALDDAARSRCR